MSKTLPEFACPCCGHRTLFHRPENSWQLCELCLWEDDPTWESLLPRAQACYAKHKVYDISLTEYSRQPTPEETRPRWWFPLDDALHILGPEVESAFATVSLDGGVSLAEAELIDNYVLSARSAKDPPPKNFGSGPHWSQLEEELEDYHWCNFTFQDARGLRYHLPAYMMCWLKNPAAEIAFETLVYSLKSHPDQKAFQALLTPPQNRIVARFLAWLAVNPGQALELEASQALKAHWGQFLDVDHQAQLGLP